MLRQPLPTAMHIATLFRHQWLRLVRSPRSAVDYLTAFFLGLMGLYAAITLVAFGVLFPAFIEPLIPTAQQEPILAMQRVLGVLLVASFALRTAMQSLPKLPLVPYLARPVPRRKLAQFLVLASHTTWHNALPLLIFLPFVLVHGEHIGEPLGWLVAVLGAFALLHPATLLLRSLLASHTTRLRAVGICVAALLAGLLALDYFTGGGGVYAASAWTFAPLSSSPWFAAVLLWLGFAALTTVSYAALLGNLGQLEPTKRIARSHHWIDGFGPHTEVAHWVRYELKLILRHSRTRKQLYGSAAIGLIYGMYFGYSSDGTAFVQLVAVLFMSGAFALNYGQLMFGWESTYFDGIMSRPIDLDVYVRAKLRLLQLSCIGLFVLSLPFLLVIVPDLLVPAISLLAFNAGVLAPQAVFLSLYNRKPLQLNEGGLFSMEGFTAKHWIWALPVLVPPLLALLLPSPFDFGVLAAVGLAGVSATRPISRWLAIRVKARRYLTLEGFRATAS